MKIPSDLEVLQGTYKTCKGYIYCVGIDYNEGDIYILGKHEFEGHSGFYVMFVVHDLSISREATNTMVDAYYDFDHVASAFLIN